MNDENLFGLETERNSKKENDTFEWVKIFDVFEYIILFCCIVAGFFFFTEEEVFWGFACWLIGAYSFIIAKVFIELAINIKYSKEYNKQMADNTNKIVELLAKK